MSKIHVLGKKNVDEEHIALMVAPESGALLPDGNRATEPAFLLHFPKDHPHIQPETQRVVVGRDFASGNYIYQEVQVDKASIEISQNDLLRLLGELQERVAHLEAVLRLVDDKGGE